MNVRPGCGRAGGRRRGQAGFTLLELLVALALIGLMAILLTGGLRFGARVWETSRDHTEAINDVAVVRGFVRERALAIRPVRAQNREAGNKSPFSGDRHSLRFVTLMPSYVSRGGLYYVALSMGHGKEGLWLSWWPFGGRRDGPGSGKRELLEGAKGMEVSYFGNPDRRRELTWLEDWPEGRALPLLISIKVSFPAGDPRIWPELIVSIPASDQATTARGRERDELLP